MSQSTLERLYASIDTHANAARLMADHELHPDFPHHRAQSVTARGAARRVQVHITQFGSNRGTLTSPWHLHRVWLNSGDRLIEEQLWEESISTRSGAKGTWRVERSFVDLDAALAEAERLAHVGRSTVAHWAKLTEGRKFAFQPASHLRPGMVVPILEGSVIAEDEIVGIEREPYSGVVYDLNVKHLHNYVAEGMVVHNCIYSFRGADPTLLESFGVDYPDARRYVLDQNHRSTATIVTLANAIAEPLASRPNSWTANPAGPAARLYRADDELDEARFIADEVVRLLAGGHITEPGQAAVLFRTNAQARVIADALRSHGLPVQLRADQDVFARPEIRDLLAYLRLAHNPNDTPALARILDTPPRGLRLVERAFRRKPVPLADLAESAHGRGGAAARRAVEDLVSLLADIHAASTNKAPVGALELVLERTNYAVWLTNQQDGPARLQNLEHLHALLEHTSAPDLGTWLADLHLGETDAAPDQRCVSLLTVHAAKGREWPVVFVTGIEEGLLPHVRPAFSGHPEPSDDEERRLTYVALSRCKVLLYLTYCRTRRTVLDGQPGRPEPQQPSRYLRGLPMDLIARVA